MPQPSISSSKRGIFFLLTAMLIFSLLNAAVKEITVRYDPLQLVFFRCFFAAIPAALFLMTHKGWMLPSPSDWKIHLKRAFLIAIGFTFLYTGIGRLSLSDSMALYFSSTFFLVLLSYPILREKITFAQWMAVVIGIFGVLIIANPTGDVFHWGALCVLLGAFMEAAYNLFGRQLSSNHNSYILTFLGSLLPGLLLLIPLPFVWITPDLNGWIALVCLGLGGGIGQLCVTFAYTHAPAGTLAPMVYSAIIWSVLLDIILYGNWPTMTLLLGCCVVVLSALLILFTEKQSS